MAVDPVALPGVDGCTDHQLLFYAAGRWCAAVCFVFLQQLYFLRDYCLWEHLFPVPAFLSKETLFALYTGGHPSAGYCRPGPWLPLQVYKQSCFCCGASLGECKG